jgi:hypothetical protein
MKHLVKKFASIRRSFTNTRLFSTANSEGPHIRDIAGDESIMPKV